MVVRERWGYPGPGQGLLGLSPEWQDWPPGTPTPTTSCPAMPLDHLQLDICGEIHGGSPPPTLISHCFGPTLQIARAHHYWLCDLSSDYRLPGLPLPGLPILSSPNGASQRPSPPTTVLNWSLQSSCLTLKARASIIYAQAITPHPRVFLLTGHLSHSAALLGHAAPNTGISPAHSHAGPGANLPLDQLCPFTPQAPPSGVRASVTHQQRQMKQHFDQSK